MTALLASMIQVCRMAESCDFDDPALKKLCRKVESQEKYLEKIVDIGYKTETVCISEKYFVVLVSELTEIIHLWNGPRNLMNLSPDRELECVH